MPKNNKKSKVTKTPTKKTVKKVKPPVVAATPVVVPTTSVTTVTLTEAQRIWEEIKNRPILMFGLPSQTVDQHCTFITVEPSGLYVTIRSSATLPSLETAISPDFTVELVDKFVVIRRTPKPLLPSKNR